MSLIPAQVFLFNYFKCLFPFIRMIGVYSFLFPIKAKSKWTFVGFLSSCFIFCTHLCICISSENSADIYQADTYKVQCAKHTCSLALMKLWWSVDEQIHTQGHFRHIWCFEEWTVEWCDSDGSDGDLGMNRAFIRRQDLNRHVTFERYLCYKQRRSLTVEEMTKARRAVLHFPCEPPRAAGVGLNQCSILG